MPRAAAASQRVRAVWLQLLDSLWFVPALVVVGCIALALFLIEAHGWGDPELAQRWPRLFGSGSAGARSMLSAIATSMATVAGVVFSVTIVALSQASSQYSPRVLGNFMSDRPTQVVLGTFVGIFAYCLVVLRTVRGDEAGAGAYMPSYAVLGGVVLALFGVSMLIYFIHHVAASIQASSIIQRIADDTAEAIDELFPQPLGQPVEPLPAAAAEPPERCWPLLAPGTGYVVGVDDEGLLRFAERHERVLHLVRGVGDFVVAGQPLVHLSGTTPLAAADADALRALFDLQRKRTIHQDAPYGVQQLVDVAVKALSPGINDPTTAAMCIDRLGALLLHLGSRHMPGPFRGKDGVLRVVAHGPRFGDVAALAFDTIAAHARGDAAVIARLIDALALLADNLHEPEQRTSLERRLALIRQALRDVQLAGQRKALFGRVRMLASRLAMAAPQRPALTP